MASLHAKQARYLREFRRDLRKFTDGLPEREMKLVRDKIALQGLSGVVTRTPVDTGMARGSWQVSHGSEETRQDTPPDKGGSQAISQGSTGIRAAPAFTVLYISSPLIYMPFLENGSSRQAPEGMVAVTAAQLRQQFRGIVR